MSKSTIIDFKPTSQESCNNSDMGFIQFACEFLGMASLVGLLIFGFLFLPEIINIWMEK